MMSDAESSFSDYVPLLAAGLSGIMLLGGTLFGLLFQRHIQERRARRDRLVEGYDRYLVVLRQVRNVQHKMILGGATDENLLRWDQAVNETHIAHTSLIVRGAPENVLRAMGLLQELISSSDFTTGVPAQVQAATDRVDDAQAEVIELMRKDLGPATK